MVKRKRWRGRETEGFSRRERTRRKTGQRSFMSELENESKKKKE